MQQSKLRAVFMRGGTSKAVIFHREDLPSDRAAWAPIFRAVIGSPDPYLRQLDGMGGGVSSVSKVCIVGPSTHPDADVDYTFAQVAVKDGRVDFSAICGNMCSAIGPFAIDEGLLPCPPDGIASVRIYNTNTSKLIHAHFHVQGGAAAVDGEMTLDGVTGAGAPIRLDFLNPGGPSTGRLLPTGHACDTLEVPGVGAITASLVDAANPCVFVEARALGATGIELPGEIERNPELLRKLEAVRRTAAVSMGLAPDTEAASLMVSLPLIALVSSPADAPLLSGVVLGAAQADILVRMMSAGQPHRAVPLTGALCLAVACRIPDSLPAQMVVTTTPDQDIRIGHPSGVIVVAANVELEGDKVQARHASAYRTARRLFKGEVYYRKSVAR